MGITSLFINRPVLSIVLNIVIVVFGLLSARLLGVRDYPAVDPPVVTVSTSYGGASADVVESKITEPLEQSINGIAGIRTLTSTSSDGASSVTVEFNLGTDLEAAANDVRDRVSRARRNLPADADDPVVIKADANSGPVLFLTLQSDGRSPLELTDYANDVFKDRLQTIPEVSEVRIWGEKKRAMRLWMDPSRMAAAGITAQDVKLALDRENIDLPTGRIEGASVELTIKTSGGLETRDDFENLILRESGGTVIRFRDIGEAVDGAENERTVMKRDGIPMIGVVLIPQPGANYIAIADEFYKRLHALRAQLPPDITANVAFDTTAYIRTSITEVIETIAIAFLLVVLVIFSFLRNWRATLIPVLAMPISLTGAFFVMYASGFSINILTLLGIVLATGLVVDDAIVVMENIYQKIEQGDNPRTAGHRGAAEIFFAIISTTLSLASVMLPIVIMPGMSGRLFREFGTVVAGAVLLSAFVSLSLTPMLCTRILRHHDPHEHSLYGRTEPFFIALANGYRRLLEWTLHRKWIAAVVFGISAAALGIFFAVLPRELAPMEDRSRFSISVTGPEGATFEYMASAMDRVAAVLGKYARETNALIAMVPGGGASASGAVNGGSARVMLLTPEKRTLTQQKIVDAVSRELRTMTDVRAIAMQEQTIGDRRGGLPVQVVIAAPSIEILKDKVPRILGEAMRNPAFQAVDVNMKFSKPLVRLHFDRGRARDLGVSVFDIAQSLQLAFSGARYGYYVRDGRQYSIIGQLARRDRSTPLDLAAFTVRNNAGRLIPLDNLVTMTEESNPPLLYHYNRTIAATISASLAPGTTIGEGIAAMQGIAAGIIDGQPGVSTALSGPSRDFAESSSNLLQTFLFALLLVYLVLAAQFESFRHPFTVMLTVPLALAGALFSLWYFNQSLNVFSQIGMIMLVGLVTKNGILIVEFANQRRRAGMAVYQAVVAASASRFRPIVMTSLTVMLGSLPIALALGASAKSRVSLGIVVIGGLLFSLVLSLFVIPIMYILLAEKRLTSPPTVK